MKCSSGMCTMVIAALISFSTANSMLASVPNTKAITMLPLGLAPDHSRTDAILKAAEFEQALELASIGKLTHNYSDKEELCLAHNIYFEARSESDKGQTFVAWTTVNRAKHRRWRSTICGVVWQRKQFSWTHDGKADTPREKAAWKRSRAKAYDVLVAASNGFIDPTGGALYYHADTVKPIWRKQLTKLTQIDTHIFYK